MPKFETFDLAQATEQVPGRFVIQLTFAELCDAYESAHPCDSVTRLLKWRQAFGDRGAWAIDRDTFARAAEAMSQAGQRGDGQPRPVHHRQHVPLGPRGPQDHTAELPQPDP